MRAPSSPVIFHGGAILLQDIDAGREVADLNVAKISSCDVIYLIRRIEINRFGIRYLIHF